MASNIRRVFGMADDTAPGGTNYDALANYTPAYTPPDSTQFWPVTGGNLDRGLERINRNTEVRSRRPVNPPISFRAAPAMTVPGPSYPSLLKKLFKKTLGGTDTVTGTGPYVHTIAALPFGSTSLPTGFYQMIRDDLNHKMSGGMVERLTLSMPLDGESTFDADFYGLYYMNSAQASPTPSFSDVADVLMLRDVVAYIDGSGTALAAPAAPVPTTVATGGTILAGVYGVIVTYVTATGETVGSIPGTVTTTGSTSTITVPSPSASGSATGWYAYVTQAGGTTYTRQQTAGSPTAIGTALTLTAPPTSSGANPPVLDSTGGTRIGDLIDFEFSFTNNLARKWYAGRNIVSRTVGTAGIAGNPMLRKLWFPTEHKLGAAQDVTYAMTFGNTSTAQDVALDFAQVQRFIVNCVGGLAPGQVYNEALGITIYAGEHGTTGGPEALQARGDTTYRVEGGGFYSDVDAADVLVSVSDGISTPTT